MGPTRTAAYLTRTAPDRRHGARTRCCSVLLVDGVLEAGRCDDPCRIGTPTDAQGHSDTAGYRDLSASNTGGGTRWDTSWPSDATSRTRDALKKMWRRS